MRTLIPNLNPPAGDLRGWAQNVHDRLRSLIEHHNKGGAEPVQLPTKIAQAKATQNGIIMWDATLKVPVVSVDGVWKKVTLT